MTSMRKNFWFMGGLYILVFFLLAEWLTPVIVLTNTGHKSLFLFFIAVALIMAFLKTPWWISGPFKILYIIWFVGYVYTGTVFFTAEVFRFLWDNFTTDTQALYSQNWADTTDVFRTILFFALLWMSVYLTHYWVSYRLSIFLFYVLTVVFVAILDTFSPYSGNIAIVRIMVVGLLLAGLLHLARWIERHRVELPGAKIATYMIPLFLAIAAVAAVALYLPKSGPIWPDPVPYITSFSDQAGSGPGGTVGRIGYGVDDSQLGGSFIGDNTPVFRAEVADGQYWKVESKDIYTTKGWELTGNVGESRIFGNGDFILTDFVPGEEAEQDNALIAMEQDFPFIFYPYGTTSVLMDGGEVDYQYNTADQRIETYRSGQPLEPDVYELAYSEPVYSLTALRGTTEADLANLPAEFDRYKQLPAELPQRVRDLAAEITADADSVYEKARTIENYFSNGEFEYSQVDIPVPAEDQDYVDQFLFETKRGYCDNFSTSMVVMLRSLDIPARWVKGFNEGELLTSEDGRETYRITNNNAHSWVEAYMPGIGWMLFEPTIGFTGSAAIDFDLEVDQAEEDELAMPERPNPVTQEEDESVPAEVDDEPTRWNRIGVFLEDNIGKILWGLAGTLLFIALVYKVRKKWLPKVLLPYYRFLGDNALTFEKAYLRLLKQLDLYGIKRQEGQTLRSYAAYIDSFFGSHDMSKLTQAYERSVYGGEAENIHWHELKESWENLIKKTSG